MTNREVIMAWLEQNRLEDTAYICLQERDSISAVRKDANFPVTYVKPASGELCGEFQLSHKIDEKGVKDLIVLINEFGDLRMKQGIDSILNPNSMQARFTKNRLDDKLRMICKLLNNPNIIS